ncbi:MAG TPA: SURF1 family protein [Gammaproteobacteria bacterium]
MRIGNREFRPRIVPTLAAAVVFGLLMSLGFWQLDRAAQKAALHAAFLERSSAPPVLLDDTRMEADTVTWRRVRLRGRYDATAIYLLDNQVHAGQAGYLVYSPFVTDGGRRVLVSRGWIPAGTDRTRAPSVLTSAGELELEGLAKPPPITPVRGETPPEPLAAGMWRVQQIDLAAIGARHAWQLPGYEVRLDAPETGFVRDWPAPGSGRERHLGYAFQWFAMAAVLGIIWIVVNLKRAGPAT